MTPLLCALALLATDAWVLVRDEQRVTMSGDLSNLRTAQKLMKKFGPKFLWFRHGGKEYVVREGEVLKRAEAVTEGDGETDARVTPEQLLERDRQREAGVVAHRRLREEVEGVQPDLGGLLHDRQRELLSLVPFMGGGAHHCGGEVVDPLLDLLLVLVEGKREVSHPEIVSYPSVTSNHARPITIPPARYGNGIEWPNRTPATAGPTERASPPADCCTPRA